MYYLRVYLWVILTFFVKELWSHSQLYVDIIDQSNKSYFLELRGIIYIEDNLNYLITLKSNKKLIKTTQDKSYIKKHFVIKTEDYIYKDHNTFIISEQLHKNQNGLICLQVIKKYIYDKYWTSSLVNIVQMQRSEIESTMKIPIFYNQRKNLFLYILPNGDIVGYVI